MAKSAKKTFPYLNTAIGSVIIGLLMIWLTKSPHVTLTDDQYLLFKILLSLSTAALSFSFSGLFHFKYKDVLFASGSFAVFLLILFYVPELRNAIPLVINLRDINNDKIRNLSGTLTLGGNVKQTKDIEKDGSVTFQYKFQEDSVLLDLDAEGWLFLNKRNNIYHTFINNGKPYYINLIRNQSQSSVYGYIYNGKITNKRSGLEGVNVSIDTMKTITDINGYFKIYIPQHLGADFFDLKISKKGYNNNNEYLFKVSRGRKFESSIQ